MSEDGFQGMLFGATSVEDDTPEDGPVDELRLCALNVNSPSAARAQRIVDWLLATKCNALVLTEMQRSDGGILISASLEAEGFKITRSSGWAESRYHAAVATCGFDAFPVHPAGFHPCISTIDLAVQGSLIRLAGIYGPTNGMTAESSARRRDFQRRLLDYLATVNTPSLCVAGDLNVVEPDHRPRLPAFQDHDYAFYTGLLALGLRDAYREVNPAGGDHSWISPRLGSQRLDHTLVSKDAGQIRSCSYDHSTRDAGISDHAALLTTIGLSAPGATKNPLPEP